MLTKYRQNVTETVAGKRVKLVLILVTSILHHMQKVLLFLSPFSTKDDLNLYLVCLHFYVKLELILYPSFGSSLTSKDYNITTLKSYLYDIAFI